MHMGDVIFQLYIFLMLILIFVSFAFFISSLLKNQRQKVQSSKHLEQKLDRIIELLEKKNEE
ncbi:MAG: DUF4083 domain-containing protein [Bacillus sp. (in: Bacteria)]|jgi:NADH:ubiquinone oxidoreductase subunit 3 (subunit A)|nr:DUF4083 domain-containing protein [Bacillus sp. (in: firmicutes)]